MKRHVQRRRLGFTVAELVVAFLILSVAMLIAAQLALQSFVDRQRTQSRHEALECAANILEAARAEPWDRLTAEWAAEQKLPETVLSRMLDARLKVDVAAEGQPPGIKRVTVEVSWRQTAEDRGSFQLAGLFADRSRSAKGEKP